MVAEEGLIGTGKTNTVTAIVFLVVHVLLELVPITV